MRTVQDQSPSSDTVNLAKKRKHQDDTSTTNGELMNTSREDRREAKRLKRLRKDVGSATASIDDDVKVEGKTDADRKAAKSARKAEKAKLKAEKTGKTLDVSSTGPKAPNGVPGSSTVYVREHSDARDSATKDVRKREKARRKAEEGANTPAAGNRTSASTKEVPNGAATTEVDGGRIDGGTPQTVRKQEKAQRKAEKKAIAIAADLSAPKPSSGTKRSQESKSDSKDSIQAHKYEEDAALSALPQNSIDSFLSTHHISIADTSTTSRSSLRPIVEFKHLPNHPETPPCDSPFLAFKQPSPIQAAAWPHLFAGRDVIGIAETGSGKTLAFGVPCIRAITAMKSSPKGSPARAVIVSPTRELASQIHVQLEALAKPVSLRTVCVYGGVPKEEQRAALKSAHIIVATPGRLNDLVSERSADLSQVRYLVLDEADRMLDKGFEDAIREIITQTPTTGRQTSMFTATWPQSVRQLASTFLTNPIRITIGDNTKNNPSGELRANRSIKQVVEVIEPTFKEGRLRELIKQYSPNAKSGALQKNNRVLVFCLYKKEAARIDAMLRKTMAGSEMKVAAIHGDMSQPLRTASINQFKSGIVSTLVATDVAARGLDIPDVKVVINVTFPLTVEDYVHRIGRTGRAGKEGLAITLFTEHDKALAGGLVNVLKAADQEVPEELLRFGTTVRKKAHEAYGNFYRQPEEGEKREGTKIVF